MDASPRDLYLNLHDFSVKPVDTKILCLMKVGQKEHLEKLAQGELFCHHLSHYKKPEFKDRPFYDEHEGLMQVAQADQVYLALKDNKTGKEHKLELAPGTQMKVSVNLHAPVFCLHAIHTGEWTHREFTEDEAPMFREFLQVPEEMEKFKNNGEEPYVFALTQPNEFFERVGNACERDGIGLTANLVRYIDLAAFHGKVPDARVGFVKQRRYEREREYRIIFRGVGLPNPFKLNIGDVRDISMLMTLKEFKESWQLGFR